MTNQEDRELNHVEAGPSVWLIHQWILAAIANASARYIPFPFIDDFVRARSQQFVVARTLATHERSFGSGQVTSLWSPGGGWLSGCVGFVLWQPIKLLLFPVRKTLAILGSVRGVPNDLMKTILLGRTLDRCLQMGMLNDGDDAETRARRDEEARHIRAAFDQAYAGMDLLTVRTALGDALTHVDGWRKAAMRLGRSAMRSRHEPPETLKPDPTAEDGAQQMAEVLARPETLELMQRFDERVDERLGELLGRDVAMASRDVNAALTTT